MEDFFEGYVTAALWSSMGDDGTPLDEHEGDLAPEALERMRKDCEAFFAKHGHLINSDNCKYDGCSPEAYAGHDFWLTRNGHGAGFWDGDWREPAADVLDNAARKYGGVDLYVGDDNRIYAMGG